MLSVQDFVKLRKAGLSTKEITTYAEDWQEYQKLEESKNEVKNIITKSRSSKLPENLYEEWRNKLELSIYESGTVGIHVRELIEKYMNELKSLGKHVQFLRDRLTDLRKKNVIFCTHPGEKEARWFHFENIKPNQEHAIPENNTNPTN